MGRGRNTSGKKWRSKVARVAKSVALRQLEQKSVTVDLGPTNIYKDGGNTISVAEPALIYPLRQMSVGVGAADFIGDEVTLKRLHINFMFRNDPASQTVTMWRVLVGWLNPGITSVLNNWRIGTGSDAVASFVRTPLDQNTVWKKLLFDKTWNVNSILSGVSRVVKAPIRIDLHNKKYTCDPITKFGTQEDLVIMLTGSSSTGTVLTTSLGQYDGYYRFWYKDG